MSDSIGAHPSDRAGHERSPSAGSSPSGAHPLRVRVILDCDWADLQHALDMVVSMKPSFDRTANRPGWGWWCARRGKPELFVRRTKQGFSATASRDSDTHLKDGDVKQAPLVSGAAIAQTQSEN